MISAGTNIIREGGGRMSPAIITMPTYMSLKSKARDSVQVLIQLVMVLFLGSVDNREPWIALHGDREHSHSML